MIIVLNHSTIGGIYAFNSNFLFGLFPHYFGEDWRTLPIKEKEVKCKIGLSQDLYSDESSDDGLHLYSFPEDSFYPCIQGFWTFIS